MLVAGPVVEGAGGGGAFAADAHEAEVVEVAEIEEDGLFFVFADGFGPAGGGGAAEEAAEAAEFVGLDAVVIDAGAEEPELAFEAGGGFAVAEVLAVFVDGVGGVVEGPEGGGEKEDEEGLHTP